MSGRVSRPALRAIHEFRARLVVADGDSFVVLPKGRPLLEYYANSIAHLIPVRGPRLPFHKAHEIDPTLPRLRPS